MGAVRFDLDQQVTVLAPNDDNWVGPIALAFPFFGYTSCYVNNNGSIGFQFGTSAYYPNALPGYLGPDVCCYWTDVDTRSDPLGLAYVRYGTAILDGNPVFLVTWFEVGIYRENYTQRGTYQIILSENRIELNYDKVLLMVGSANRYDNPRAGLALPSALGFINGGAVVTDYGDILSHVWETQLLTFLGGPATQGSYILTLPLNGFVPSALISFDATAARVQSALEASSLGVGNVTATGDVGGPFTIKINVAALARYYDPLTVVSNTLRNAAGQYPGAVDLALVLDPVTGVYEFPGSGSGAYTSPLTPSGYEMMDGGTHALIASSRGTDVLGRYIFGFDTKPNLSGDPLGVDVRFFG